MQTQLQKTNICPACIHASECVHNHNSHIAHKPIWFCENFDNTTSLQVVETKNIYSEEQSALAADPCIEAIPGRMIGLCINCDNRVSCKFLIREGGVWHCEEYC